MTNFGKLKQMSCEIFDKAMSAIYRHPLYAYFDVPAWLSAEETEITDHIKYECKGKLLPSAAEITTHLREKGVDCTDDNISAYKKEHTKDVLVLEKGYKWVLGELYATVVYCDENGKVTDNNNGAVPYRAVSSRKGKAE